MLQLWQNGILWLLQVVMLFAADFWGGADMFGRLAPSTEERGKFFLFYSYTGISGKHIHSRPSTGNTATFAAAVQVVHFPVALVVSFFLTFFRNRNAWGMQEGRCWQPWCLGRLQRP